MKKRTSSMSRRIVSLLMSLVLTLTLVTPAAFATEVVDGSGTAIIEGNANPADANPNEDTEGKDDENKDTEHGGDEQPTNPGDEDKNPGEGEGDDANKPDEDKKDEAPDGENKDEENKDEQPTEDENNGEDDISLLNDENGTDVWVGNIAEKFAGGTGTESDPYQISNGAELAYLAQQVNAGESYSDKYFTLTADIRLNTADVPAAEDSPNSWTPIGKPGKLKKPSIPFSGTFDGRGHTVSGLYIESTATCQGLFGYIGTGATVQNLIVTGTVTVNSNTAGGIAGKVEAGVTVTDCGFRGTVSALAYVGGIVGNCAGTVNNCYNLGSVSGTQDNSLNVAGGIVGNGNGATVSNCYNFGAVNAEGSGTAGGIVGSGTAQNCYYLCKVSNEDKSVYVDGTGAEKDITKTGEGAATKYMVGESELVTLLNDWAKTNDAAAWENSSVEPYAPVFKAEGDTPTPWNGTDVDISWYVGHESDTEFSISTAAQLAGLAALVNGTAKDADSKQIAAVNFSGKTIKLAKDIDLNNQVWTPIGTQGNPFKGEFDGGQHSVANLKLVNTDDSGSAMIGLFGNINSGTVSNLTVSGEVSEGGIAYDGGIAGNAANATILNCVSSVKITDTAGSYIGGIAGNISGNTTIKNCSYTGEMSGFECTCAGGIVGQIEGSGKVQNSYAVGTLAVPANGSDTFAGGIVGDGGTAQNCYYLCKVYNEDKSVYVDGNGTEKDITKTGEGAATKYMVGESELVTLLNDWAKTNDAAAWENSAEEPYAPVFKAEGDTPTPWNGTVDTSWYDASKDTFEIRTAAELAGLAALVNSRNNFSGKTVKLTADIDLNNQAWTPIGNGDSCAFSGTFDGDQHIICGLNVKIKSGSYAGLFGYVYDGTVENLTAEGSVESAGEAYIAGIVGMLDGESEDPAVKNCVSRVAVSETVSDAELVGIGGIVGFSYGLISDCLNEGSVTITEESSGMLFVGGIAGMSMGEIRDCRNVGVVTNSADASSMDEDFCVAAGIAGYNLGEVHSCANESLITSKGKACGIAPCDEDDSGESGSVANCYNLGNVTGVTAYGFGVSSGTAQNCYYLCKVNGEDKSVYMDAAGAENAITKTGEGAETKYMVDESELVTLLNDWAKTNDAAAWENSSVEPYAPVFKAEGDVPEDKVTITYRANGGTGGITDTVDKDTEYTIRDGSGFSCKGKKLVGWNTSADGMGTSYEFAKKITVSEDLKLYAVWKNIWEGSGTETDPYRIQTAEDWAEMQAQAAVYDNYTGVWFSLTASITLPEAYEPFFFRGNLKGNGNTITVDVSESIETGKHSRGLFSSIIGGDAGIRIENLTVAGSVAAYWGAGGLAGNITGKVTLENVTSNVTVKAGGYQYDTTSAAGGLCASYSGDTLTVKNCRNEGAVTGHTAGGLVGSYNGTTAMDFSGCTNSGTVHGENAAAGLLGFNARTNDPNSSFTNCSNTGEIIASGRAAGIAVLSTRGKVEGCTNSGAITGDIAAGILCSGVAKRSVNTGKITGKTCGAGIAANNNSGYTWYTMEFCANFGEVTAVASVNGLLAFGIARQGKISNCFTYNKTSHVPISGVASKQCTVSDSYYLANSDTEFPSTMGGTPATLDDFTSGKVAWGVGGKGEGSQGGTGQDAKLGWWKQDKNDAYPTLLDNPDMSKRYYRTDVDCGTGGEVELARNASSTVKELSSKEAVYGPAGTSVTIKATPKDNTFGLKSLTWTHNGQTDVLPAKGTTNIVMPAESNGTIHAEFASVGPGGNGGYYYGGSGDGTGTGDKDDEGLQDGLNMDVEYDIKGLVLGAYAEWGSNGGNKSFQKWLEENPNVVRALLTNSLDNMATAAVGKKTDEAKDLAALLLASLNEHTGVDGKNGDTIAKALQKYIDSGSEEVFSAWLTGGGGMASGTYESIYGQYASSLAALADRLYSKWEASGTSMTFPVWLDSQQVTMESLSENAEEPDAEPDDTQTTEAPEDVPDGQDTEGGASGNSVWEVIGTVVRENPILVWSIVAVIAALIIVGAVRRYHKVKRDEHDEK